MITPLMPDVIAVEVPEGATNFRLLDECSGKNVRGLFYEVGEERPWQVLPEGNWAYLFCTADASEEQAAQIVENIYTAGGHVFYANYKGKHSAVCTAKESLQSLLKSVGLDPKGNYPVLRKLKIK